MERKKNIKNKWLHLRLDEEEHKLLTEQFSKTTERKLSRYARKILLAKPIVTTYRNTSLDDIIAVLTRLQNDLNGVANNYNQMIHKLHLLDSNRELKAWIDKYESEQQLLLNDIATIKDYIKKTAEKWLQ